MGMANPAKIATKKENLACNDMRRSILKSKSAYYTIDAPRSPFFFATNLFP
jgi:hypothetical protein